MRARYEDGIEISPGDLIRARPPREQTGFAPGGKVATHLHGADQSIFFGRGMEYAESRAYQPGDDPRSIDWRLSARASRTYTKLFHEERERPVFLLVDLREAMQFGTRKRFKAHLAAELAAMLAWAGHDGGDRVGALILTRAGLIDVAPSRSRGALLGLLRRISDATRMDAPKGEEPELTGAIRRLARVARPGSLAFILSDFSDMTDETRKELRRLKRRAQVTLMPISDPMEAEIPKSGGRISDGSGVVNVTALSREAREKYHDSFEQRQARLRRWATQLRMAFMPVATPDDPASALIPMQSRRAEGKGRVAA